MSCCVLVAGKIYLFRVGANEKREPQLGKMLTAA